ncbi:hypothetical protein BBP40_011916 [Aspergillus hancockii]|nr:hypothetical protein BBP40_011916 [Aspergillus hancockii]
MVEHFNLSAIDRIHAEESRLRRAGCGYAAPHCYGILPSSQWWSHKQKLLFDDHNYEIYLVRNAATKEDMTKAACADNRESNVSPKIVGEWSLAFDKTGDSFLPMTGAHAQSYSRWFSAQQGQYEALDGWFFWTWKTDDLPNVAQWDYQKAVEAGIISKDLNAQYAQSLC